MISTRSSNDEELENMSFENLQEMAENLKCLAKTNDEEIGYVDIHMPAPLLQVRTCECTVFTYQMWSLKKCCLLLVFFFT